MMVIAYDNRGIGKSSRPDDPYSLDTLVDDLKNLLEYLNIREQIHLCGFSNGSAIAQSFTLKYPYLVKTLILLGAASHMPNTEYEQSLKAVEAFKSLSLEQIIRLTLPNMFSLPFRKKLKRDKELFKLYKNDIGLIAHLNDPPRYEDYINQWKILKGFDTRDLLPNIKQPTLIVVGSKDQGNILASKNIYEKIPNSKIEILENVGHAIIIESPETTNRVIWNFLKHHLTINNTN